MKRILFTIAVLMSMTLFAHAQQLTTLWNEVDKAVEKDLPKTAIDKLEKIITLGRQQKQYGHVLKAELQRIQHLTSISPDSLRPAIEALVKTEAALRDDNPLLDAVYCSVLGNVYRRNPSLSEDAAAVSADYFRRSLAQPELLAQHKIGELEPLLKSTNGSRLFDDDLLHVLANEAGDALLQQQHYNAGTNRVAAMLSTLRVLRRQRTKGNNTTDGGGYVARLDSLLNIYQDLPWAGEIAYERYRYMSSAKNVEPKQVYDYVKESIQRWEKWERVDLFKSALATMTQAQFDAALGVQQMRSNERRTVTVTGIRNMPDLILTVTPIDIDGRQHELSPNNEKDYALLKKKMASKPLLTQRHSYAGIPAWQVHTDSFVVADLPLGAYLVELTSSNAAVEDTRQLLFVSDLYVMGEGWPDNRTRYTIVDAKTGNPVPHATLELINYWDEKTTPPLQLTADERGEVVFQWKDGERYNRLWASTSNDKAFVRNEINVYYNFHIDQSIYTDSHFFTDRSLYRPGQIVHVAFFVNKRHADNSMPVVEGRKAKLQLLDANYKVVDEKEVTTDRYGAASADFELPTQGLTGRWQVRATGLGSVAFNVEEYKRPTFFVEFDDVKEQYQLGDTVTLTGRAKSYAGVPVQNAKVKYKVTSRQASWWRFYYDESANRTVSEGELTTDDKGEFKVNVPLTIGKKDDNVQAADTWRVQFYTFTVNADVTDLGGETHAGMKSLPIGTRPTALYANLPDKEEKDSLTNITFTRCNAAGQQIAGEVTYWWDDNTHAYTAQANTPVDVKAMVKTLRTGRHTLHAVCGNDTLKEEIVLFSTRDSKPCVTTHDWFYVPQTIFPANGKPLKVQLGASDDNVCVYYSAMANGKLIEHGMTRLSNAIITKEYKYREDYGDGLLLTYAWVREGKLYTHSVTLTKPLPDKHLDVKWHTFRNRLEPGQQETWTAIVTTPQGLPADAQLTAVMYDKSLDQIKPHHWWVNTPLRTALPRGGWDGLSYRTLGTNWYARIKSYYSPGLYYTSFDTSLFNFYSTRVQKYNGAVRYDAMPMVLESAPMAMGIEGRLAGRAAGVAVTKMKAAKAGDSENAAKAGYSESAEMVEEEQPTSDALIRENLAETAFFFPALNTDAEGKVTMQFTLPESLTTWKVMALAHDTNTNYGLLTDEAVAKKKVMVQPNMPRFVRAHDNATIAARIINTSEKDISGQAIMELLDPETRKVVHRQTMAYNLSPDATQAVTFTLQPTGDTPIYICRLIAQGADHSDGEQHYLAVLPDKERVTNTYPFTLHRAETKTIDLQKLFAVNDSTCKLTMEYTNNPAWLVLQALPTYAAPIDDDAISQAAAYYVNVLGQHMAQQAPHLREVIELWRQEQGEETSLASALEKNETLKNLVLNETPWVLDADKESAQKRQLIKFFDAPTMQMRIQSAIDKLSKLQLSNGAWTWWKGMPGSIYMTVRIATILERLQMLTGSRQQPAQQMLEQAYPFIDNYLWEEYTEMRKAEKKGWKAWRPSETVINILYLNVLSHRTLSSKTQQATKYMLNLMEKRTTEFTIYGKAHTATILAGNGRTKKASEYLKSMEEYSVSTEEMGRYYDTPKAYYSWFSYKIPTQVAVIEAFRQLRPQDQQTIEELQRWLLQCKRTQAWDTPINSIDAIFAFLQGNMRALDQQEQATFMLNGAPLATTEATAGMGYVKAAQQGPDMHTLTVNKTSNSTSWGAVYAQFMQDVTDIETATAQLKVKREVVAPKSGTYRVGDKVTIRVTITAERDYDFVQVVDKRAACLEPVKQLSGYHWGYYIAPRDNATCYYFDQLRKGKHVIETEYYIDRVGEYRSGTCTAQCAYAPEYAARDKALLFIVKE